MLRDNIAFVGIGQGGNNVVFEMEKLELNSFYINTSLEDLECINSNLKDVKYHIEGTKGMAKDSDLAIDTLAENNNLGKICWSIRERYSMSKQIVFIHTAGGGTGGGMGNMIASTYKTLFPEKIVTVVLILPSSNEDILIQQNSQRCLKQLESMVENGDIDNSHVLTNNAKENKFEINRSFAMLIDQFISLEEINNKGNIDEQEISQLFSNRGYISIVEFEDTDITKGVSKAIKDSIYADWYKLPDSMGIIFGAGLNNKENVEQIRDILGVPKSSHEIEWSNPNTIIMSTGFPYNLKWYNDIGESANRLIEKREQRVREIEENKNNENLISINSEAVQSSFSKNKTHINNTVSNNYRRNRRNVPDMKSALEKMRNLGKK